MCPIRLTLNEEQWIRSVYETLSLEQKVGQLFCPTMMEDYLTVEQQVDEYALRVRHEMEEFCPGGYYLNRYYLPTTPTLLNRLMDIADVPPLICADMEAGAGGGFGGVIAPGLVTFPPAMGIGATGSERCAYQVGRCTAWQARSIGVHFVFAPVLDVNINPKNPVINTRSFGEDPEQISLLGAAYIRGLQEGGVAASAKHFPGQGDISEDTHLRIGRVTGDRERLNRVELYPYRRAIHEAGVYAILTGHLAVPALEPDPDCPATFSRIILQDLLRGEMGFDGLIVTDALLMGGITSICDPGEAAVRAFLAGADWLLMPPDLKTAYHAVLNAAKSGIISPLRLDESVIRILALKAKTRLHHQERIDLDDLRNLSELNNYPNRISFAICDNAITLVKNEEKVIPFSGTERMAVLLLTDRDDEYYDDGYTLFHEINSRSMNVKEFISIVPGASQEQLDSARNTIQECDVVLIGLIVSVLPEKDSSVIPGEYCRLIEESIALGKTVVLISFGAPYVVSRFPQVHAFICAYGYFSTMVGSVAEVLYGERIPHGKLPVSIPGVCEAGKGLRF